MGSLSLCGFVYSYLLVAKEVGAKQRSRARRRKKGSYRRNIPLIALNLVGAYGLTGLGMYYLHDLFINESFFGYTIPLALQVAVEATVVLIVDDFYFYFLHRWMHTNPYIYRKIHRIHHRNRQPTPMEYIYTHPLEWLMGMGGLTLAFLLLGGIAFETFIVYLVIRTVHEFSIHSGLPSSPIVKLIPFYGSNQHHEIHHKKFDCNYAATFTIWDKIFGTEAVEEHSGS
jgi:methylsterol monooxygenase